MRRAGGGRLTAATREPGLPWPRRGKEPAAPVLSRRAPARDRARLPFCGVAAISRRRGGRGDGGGAAAAPGLPSPSAPASASPLFFASGLDRGPPGRCASGTPEKPQRGVRTAPHLLRPLSPPKVGFVRPTLAV